MERIARLHTHKNPHVVVNSARDAIREEYFAAKQYLGLLLNYNTIRMNQLSIESERDLRTKTMPELIDVIERVHWIQQNIV
jgi:hypothetical protein